eukprot:3936959-Rhodomonas_salina.1
MSTAAIAQQIPQAGCKEARSHPPFRGPLFRITPTLPCDPYCPGTPSIQVRPRSLTTHPRGITILRPSWYHAA